ncbi:hypothetical protein [Streptomyces tubercidicus]|uniref:hypothetical protein n=1 Tax=Streptomyces tubercidicus TaxID=47759 RepID=UPI00378ECF1A
MPALLATSEEVEIAGLPTVAWYTADEQIKVGHELTPPTNVVTYAARRLPDDSW